MASSPAQWVYVVQVDTVWANGTGHISQSPVLKNTVTVAASGRKVVNWSESANVLISFTLSSASVAFIVIADVKAACTDVVPR